MPIPILMLIDVEPDPREIDPQDPAPWLGFEKSFVYFNQLRARLMAATGAPVHFNWFLRMDPQVSDVYGSPSWPVRQYAPQLRSLQEAGDEIGLHTHAWRWDGDRHRWIVDHGNQAYIDHCLDMSFKAFNEELNRPCDSFRFGDRFMNQATMNRVEALGARYELTVEPGHAPEWHFNPAEISTGPLPDLRNAPRQPYKRSAADWLQPDATRASGMTVIPLSAGAAETWKGRAKRKILRIMGRRVADPRHLTLHLSRNPDTVRVIMDHLLHELDRPYLAFLIRTDSALKSLDMSHMEGAFDRIVSHKHARDFAFSTPSEALCHMGYENYTG